jgi:hypothetical protein
MYIDVAFFTFASRVIYYQPSINWNQLIFSVDNTYADACFTSSWVGAARLTAYSCNCRAVAYCLCALTLRWVIHLMNPVFPTKLTWCQRLNYLAPTSEILSYID